MARRRRTLTLIRPDNSVGPSRSLLLPEGKRKARALPGATHTVVQAMEDDRLDKLDRETARADVEPPARGVYQWAAGETTIVIACDGKDVVLQVEVYHEAHKRDVLEMLWDWLEKNLPARPVMAH